jgi:hypothetical protein
MKMRLIKHKNLLTLAGLIITIILLSTLFGSLKTSAYTKTTSFAGGEYFLCDSPGYFDAHLQPNSSEQLFNITQNRLGNVLVVSIRCYSGAEIKVVDGLGTTEDFYAVLTCGQPGSPGAVTFSDEIRNAGTGQNVLQITCTDVNNFQLNVDGNYGGCSSNSLASPCTPTAVESRRAGQDPAEPNAESDERQSCEDNDGEFVFFQCAIISAAGGAINELDSRVRAALEVDQKYYDNPGLRGAWANFRNIAYLILVPIMLVMVISTALGFSFVDAYTVKRALPRLFFAVIFIALSYELCVLLIEVVSIIGKGIGGLIAAPFGGADELTLTKIFNPSALGGAAALGAGIIGGIALVSVGAVTLGILASYLLVGAIALIVIFGLLVMREIIIIFLIILAPLAIISWIFPGNDKLWKIWWSSFSKLLLLYPLIVGALVVGRAFALIISEAGGSGFDGIFLTFAKLVAYIGPFFLIPAMFKFAGGAFANLAGIVNNKEKGLFDRQRKYRGEARKKGYQDFNMEKRAGFISRPTNQLRRRAKAGVKGRFGTGDRGSVALDTAKFAEAEAITKTGEWQAQQENDPVLQAAASGRSRAEATKNMYNTFYKPDMDKNERAVAAGTMTRADADAAESKARSEVSRAVAQAEATIGLGTGQQIAAAKQLVATGTGYANMDQLVKTLAIASNGNESTGAQLAGYANAVTKQKARSDLSPSFNDLNNAVQLGVKGGGASQADIIALEDRALETQGMGAIIGGKSKGVKNMIPAINRRLEKAAVAVQTAKANVQTIQSGGAVQIDDGSGTGTTRPMTMSEALDSQSQARRYQAQVFASTSAAIDLAGQISPESATMLADGVHNQEIDFDVTQLSPEARTAVMTTVDAKGNKVTSTARTKRMKLNEAMSIMESDSNDFAQMKKTYGNQFSAQAAAAQAQANATASGASPGALPII